MKTKPLFRVSDRVQTTHHVQGMGRTICNGEFGIVRAASNQRWENRYLVAFPKTSNCADGVIEYWCDESILSK